MVIKYRALALSLFISGFVSSACASSPDAHDRSSAPASAESAIYEHTVNGGVEPALTSLKAGLKSEGFGVLFEANIGATLASMAERWGDDYNRSGLDAIRSVIFCNPKYANQASNEDPRSLALCPLRITLVEKAGSTMILFVRPTVAAGETGAKGTAEIVEQMVLRVIDSVPDA